ncbi:Phosphoglycerate dehydrogenase [Planococcus halocryophilus Or1]|uniref:D-2-hydroxyacid dehydrogenase n=1 Tax=Planococcus halocryophilus TaxID=1215089 RepID=A0A1C7DM09_9BACL|nr:D-2-hydroxyacid dehydrogenase [Planococcus halocryophilus]ANU12434.1 D-2-hydroxyacid dehydrogenase [Planococcus halocryophilus]EMF47188.1 Phosphoglycerate dehydrogenase [Planococcus halocryophilus Or1]
MEILFTFVPRVDQQQRIIEEFPEVDFYFLYRDKTRLSSADIIVTYGEDLTAEDIESAVKVKWIMVASAGIEKLPHQAIESRGITVSNVRGIHKTPMAESALAHLLALKRALPVIYQNQRNQQWERKIRSSELSGTTALILGPGAIGAEIGRLLQAFGVHIIGCNRSGAQAPNMDEMVSFEKIMEKLPEADYVISVLPSTDETKQLLKEEHFKAMKDTVIFMNFGRGDLVTDNVLLNALQEKEITFAVLDVFEHEPLPADHPYWSMDNVVVSPHISSKSGKYVDRTLDIFIPNLKKWLIDQSDPTNLVDMEKGY